ncbi:MAG: hypothetical protein WC738_04345 [Candidatus Omnitrophota bacterium]|jgi:hypothetical protein
MKGTINDLMVMHFAQGDYKISDEADDSVSPTTKKYYGYLNRDGEWYIMRRDLTAKTYRYFAGSSNFTDGWSGREAYDYGTYEEIFGE